MIVRHVAIDPGTRSTGVASWRPGDTYPQVCSRPLVDVVAWIDGPALVAGQWTVEVPFYRHRTGTPGDPNDLIALALRTGRLLHAIERSRGELREVLPHEWKGSLRKDQHHAQVRRKIERSEHPGWVHTWDACTTHDQRDALALLCWRLGYL